MHCHDVGSVISSQHNNSTHHPEMEINPRKTACGCLYGWAIKTVTHAMLSPYGMHLPMYDCIYGRPQIEFSQRTLHQQLNAYRVWADVFPHNSENYNKMMYLWWSLCTLHLHACQERVTVGDSCICCCTCVTYFER